MNGEIALVITFTIFTIIISYVMYSCNIHKCEKCGKHGNGEQIKFGYEREYRCLRCGNIRRERGLDY